MDYFELVRIALRSIYKNKFRSVLTTLGIIIGIAAVVVIVALGEGNRQQIQAEFKKFGADIIIMIPKGDNAFLTPEELNLLIKKNPILKYVSPISFEELSIGINNTQHDIMVIGTTWEYALIRTVTVKRGRFLNDTDERLRRNVCVIEHNRTMKQLFGVNNPLNASILINGLPFTIIGVIDPIQDNLAYSENHIIVPLQIMPLISSKSQFTHILASTYSQKLLGQAREKINLFSANYLIRKDAFEFQDFSQMLASTTAIVQKVTMIIGGIASISLLVGGIGIMNIMLVSVTERTREIGIQKAIGARRNTILLLFIIETMALCILGGTIGILLGLGLAILLSHFFTFPIAIPFLPAAIGFTFSILVGVLSGLYPAWKAANLDPIQALRVM